MRLPDTVVFPDTSFGIAFRAASKVRNLIPDFEALEMQNAKPPVYSLGSPCSLTVDIRIRRGDSGLPAFPRSNCCRVLTYSVGYFGSLRLTSNCVQI
jgi:hypothetical protein